MAVALLYKNLQLSGTMERTIKNIELALRYAGKHDLGSRVLATAMLRLAEQEKVWKRAVLTGGPAAVEQTVEDALVYAIEEWNCHPASLLVDVGSSAIERILHDWIVNDFKMCGRRNS